jgi:hypothetical protein
MENAVIGTTVYSGNTYYPTISVVKGLRTWAELPERARRSERTICYWLTEEQLAAQTYVALYTAASHRSCRWHYTTTTGFAACYYASVEEMIAAYARKAAA